MPLSRRVVVLSAVAAAALAALAVWWFTRGGDPATDRTPEQAVLAKCNADPARPPHSFGAPPGSDTVAVQVVRWTAPGERAGKSQVALVQRGGDGTWTVVNCRLRLSSGGN